MNEDEARQAFIADVDRLLESHGQSGLAKPMGIGLLLCLTVILIPVGLLVIWAAMRARKKSLARQGRGDSYREFLRSAQFVIAYPLKSEDRLANPGAFLESWCRCLIAMDGAAAHSVNKGAELAALLMEMGIERGAAYERGRRVMCPESLAPAGTAYICDVLVNNKLLAGNALNSEMPMIPCLAERGDRGLMMVFPWWYMRGQKAANATDDYAALAALDNAVNRGTGQSRTGPSSLKSNGTGAAPSN